MPDPVTVSATAEDAGSRVDAVIARHTGIARSRLVATGVSVDGEPARLKDRVARGSVIRASVERPVTVSPAPAAVEFGVAYEDPDLAVVDKPAGVSVHAPGRSGAGGPYLVNGLLRRYPEIAALATVDAPERPGIVHRLDRDTSGLLVVARTQRALAGLREAVAARSLVREYAAVVRGTFETRSGEIDAPIGRRPGSRTFSVRDDGREAWTRYEVVATWSRPLLSGLRVWLGTGRTHQIRVHLAAIGHPVVGDRSYRGPSAHGAARQFLHAHRLAFDHPCGGARVDVLSPLAPDLGDVLDTAGSPESGEVPPQWRQNSRVQRVTGT